MLLLTLTCLPQRGTAQRTLEVSPAVANEHLTGKVEPTYPAIAKAARLQGKVVLQVVVAKTGNVDSVSVVSGHPLLVQAAINAARQWKYKPFVVDGQPVAVSTEVEVPFSLGISDADYQAQQKNSEKYFNREDECRNLLKEHQYAKAEAPCTASVELAEKLPKARQMERVTANDLAGQALLYDRKYDEALSFFQTEVAIGETALKPTDAELGYAYHHVAVGYQATGDLRKAQSYYERAESTLRAAREHMDGDFFKNQYAKAIQSVLRDYIVLLQQTGQEDAAAKAKHRADAIADEIHPVKPP